MHTSYKMKKLLQYEIEAVDKLKSTIALYMWKLCM